MFHRTTILLIVCLAGCGGSDIVGVSYDEYRSARSEYGLYFDPVGANQIYEGSASTPDSAELWWRMTISATDFQNLVQDAAQKNGGPDEFNPSVEPGYPCMWKPDSEPPNWWAHDAGPQYVCYHWCRAAGAAERHHGWYFAFDGNGTVFAWHWNYQWSANQCLCPVRVRQ